MTKVPAVLATIFALGALGCGSTPSLMLPTPTPPAPVPSVYLGTWTGALTDQAAGAGSISIVFNQSVAIASGGATVSGTFGISRQTGGGLEIICFNGTAFGSDVQQVFTLNCSSQNGSITVAINDAHDQASGTYSFSGAPFNKGSVALSKH